MKKFFFFFSMCCFLIFSCTKDQVMEFECTDVAVNYTDDIKVILDLECNQGPCHSASFAAGGIILEGYEAARDYSQNSSNNFLGSIQHSGPTPMPRDAPKLPDNIIEKISCWVQNGSPE